MALLAQDSNYELDSHSSILDWGWDFLRATAGYEAHPTSNPGVLKIWV